MDLYACALKTICLQSRVNIGLSRQSSIAYMRGLFPSECFSAKTKGGLTLQSLNPSNEESHRLMEWIDRGCLPALEKRYVILAHLNAGISSSGHIVVTDHGLHLIDTSSSRKLYLEYMAFKVTEL